MKEIQRYTGLIDRQVIYTYDLSGRLKSMKYPSAQTLTYTYDALGRRTVVNDGTNDLVTDTWKGQLLGKREYYTGAYLTHLNDSGGSLSGCGSDSPPGRIHPRRTSGQKPPLQSRAQALSDLRSRKAASAEQACVSVRSRRT